MLTNLTSIIVKPNLLKVSMDFSSPGLLLVKSKNLNLERYIFCQNINDSRRSNKLTNTDSGRRNLIEYSNTRCKRKSDRANEKKSDCSASTSNESGNAERGPASLKFCQPFMH